MKETLYFHKGTIVQILALVVGFTLQIIIGGFLGFMVLVIMASLAFVYSLKHGRRLVKENDKNKK